MAPPVKAYGLDYSARELSPGEIDAFNKANPSTPIKFLIRYIGYPGNRKCISTYPGALRAHEDSGRLVLLVHQVAYQDFAGGRAAGVQHARLAVADAERAGWRWDRPIFCAFDRWLNSHDPAKGIYPIALGTVREYVAGFRSVLGDLAGLYGFWDVMQPAVRESWVRWFWQCGAEDALVSGVQFYQSNRGYVYPGGLQSDLNKSYVDVSAFGGDDVSAADVLFNTRIVGPDGATPYNANDMLYWNNRMLNDLSGIVPAILAAVSAGTNDPDITPDAMRKIVDDAVKANAASQAKLVAEQTVAVLRTAVREEMGTDNEDQADAIVDRIAARLAGAA